MEKLHGYHENRWFKKSKKAGKSKNLPIYKCASPSYHKSSQGAGNGVAPHKAYEKGEITQAMALMRQHLRESLIEEQRLLKNEEE